MTVYEKFTTNIILNDKRLEAYNLRSGENKDTYFSTILQHSTDSLIQSK